MRSNIGVLVAVMSLGLTAFFLIAPDGVHAQGGEQVEYISPVPGSRFVSPATTIAIRPGERIDGVTLKNAVFKVIGSQSGLHPGSTGLADDGKTMIFKPTQSFFFGENVGVTLGSGIRTASGRILGELSFNFTITLGTVAGPPDETLLAPEEPTTIARAPQSKLAPRAPSFVTLPADYPPVTITVAANGTGEGYNFIAPFLQTPQSPTFLLIMDNDGQPVYYKRLTARALDFKKQPNGLLTYWYGDTKFYVMDNTYSVVDTYEGGNGYTADNHEFQMLPNGNALFLIYDSQNIDMSQIVQGGQSNATVTGCIIQEQDASKNVVFEWRSWDHFLITDTYASLLGTHVDYVHCNAIELDQDGNLLLSSRTMSEITKIDSQDGHVIWRLGGKNNQFTFVGDSPPYFSYQHDIRRLPNGDITLFDNGVLRPAPQYSRAVEYEIDEVNKTATEVWQFRNTPDSFGNALGDVQRLSNGNTFIGWGGAGLATEVKPNSTKAFEFQLLPQVSYRAFRLPWHGYPTTQPTLVAQSPLGRTVLTYSWNGATDIASYGIYKGNAPQPTTLITTQAKTGFETSSNLPCDPLGTRYYRVMPVDLNRQPTQYSNDVAVTACLQYIFPLIFK